jgi:MarR family 2-MHQ and catechol resistance regulon transcriptional repressor
LPVNVLGSKVDLTSGSATAAIDRLETKKLVYRADDPNDRRARVVHLAPKGKALIEKAFSKHRADMELAMGGLNPKETSHAIELLKKLGKYASDGFPKSEEGAKDHEAVAHKR